MLLLLQYYTDKFSRCSSNNLSWEFPLWHSGLRRQRCFRCGSFHVLCGGSPPQIMLMSYFASSHQDDLFWGLKLEHSAPFSQKRRQRLQWVCVLGIWWGMLRSGWARKRHPEGSRSSLSFESWGWETPTKHSESPHWRLVMKVSVTVFVDWWLDSAPWSCLEVQSLDILSPGGICPFFVTRSPVFFGSVRPLSIIS